MTATDESVTDRVHDNSWSADLEGPGYADDQGRVVEDAIDAVERTTAGNHVNLVSHSEHGHPEGYLFEVLEEAFGDGVDYKYVKQCGCGGHVTRVHVE